jgi:RNA polymerase sigma-54 factor
MQLQQSALNQMNLNLTPKLMQSLHVLQMSSVDLIDYIHEQIVENPFMEVVSESYALFRGKNRSNDARNDQHDPFATMSTPTETLEMFLLSQLRVNGITHRQYRIAEYLAGCLNDNGYLTISLMEAVLHLQETQEAVSSTLDIMQSLEPSGVCARTLQECLQIQIMRDAGADPWAYQMVSHYLDDLGNRKLQNIAKGLGISVEKVSDSLQYIRTLNPHPGSNFLPQSINYIELDAYIVKKAESYQVIMNERCIPKLSLNSNYHHEMKQQVKTDNNSKTALAYIRDHVQMAQTLIHSLEQRKYTLYRILEAIVGEQISFFDKGIYFLRPMNLKTIAEKLDLHESTISRAIQQKYVQTPQGIYELKFFFTNGISTDQEDNASAESIKAKIRELILGENKQKTLSDQNITDILLKEGFQISRRTVMKYRDKLRLLSSHQRSIK